MVQFTGVPEDEGISEPASMNDSLARLEDQINNTLKLSENMKERKLKMKESLLETPTLRPSKALEEALRGNAPIGGVENVIPSHYSGGFQQEAAPYSFQEKKYQFAGLSDDQRNQIANISKKEDPNALQRRASQAVALSVAERQSLLDGYQPARLDRVEESQNINPYMPERYGLIESSLSPREKTSTAPPPNSSRYPGYELISGLPPRDVVNDGPIEKPRVAPPPHYTYPGYEIMYGQTPEKTQESSTESRVTQQPTTSETIVEDSLEAQIEEQQEQQEVSAEVEDYCNNIVADSLEQAPHDVEEEVAKESQPEEEAEETAQEAAAPVKEEPKSAAQEYEEFLNARRAEKDKRDAENRAKMQPYMAPPVRHEVPQQDMTEDTPEPTTTETSQPDEKQQLTPENGLFVMPQLPPMPGYQTMPATAMQGYYQQQMMQPGYYTMPAGGMPPHRPQGQRRTPPTSAGKRYHGPVMPVASTHPKSMGVEEEKESYIDKKRKQDRQKRYAESVRKQQPAVKPVKTNVKPGPKRYTPTGEMPSTEAPVPPAEPRQNSKRITAMNYSKTIPKPMRSQRDRPPSDGLKERERFK